MRKIDMSKISKDECFSVQANGLEHCKICKWQGISACEGKEIVKTGFNKLGYKIGSKGLASE
jgi:hypothetical protein